MFNPEQIKKDFPIFSQKVNGHDLVFLDSASTSQKPLSVIDAISNFYKTSNSNISRSSYSLSDKATMAFEETRITVQKFINASSPKEIIFTRNTTESLNLIAYTWGEQNIKEGDEILITIFEHHSNFVTWQALAKRKKAKLIVANLNKDLELDLEDFKKKISDKTKIVAFSATSNVLGLREDLKMIREIVRANNKNCIFIVDGAQSVPHEKTDVQEIDCDFLAFSGHKMLGPTGVGILYGKEHLLENMPPFLFGGAMIDEVTLSDTSFAKIPQKFEAGTTDVADITAFKESLNYLTNIGLENIKKHEQEIFDYTYKLFSQHKEVKILCPKNKEKRTGIFSFTIDHIHPHDIAGIFDSEGIEIRAGMHCAHPLHTFLGIPASARLSFYIYTTKYDIDLAHKALKKTLKMFS